MKISQFFYRLQEFGSKTAIIWKNHPYSYQEIVDGVLKWNRILNHYDVKPGECVAIYGDFSPNVVMLFLALIKNKSISVPMSLSMSSSQDKCLNTACVSSMFSFKSDAFQFKKIEKAFDHQLLRNLRKDGDPGLIIFTSGSSGEMKAALHNFITLLSKFETKRKPYVTLAFLTLDHIGGINTLFYTLSNGGTIVVETERNSETICKAIERHKVNLLPATPTFLKMLMISEMYKEYDLSSLKLITYGTEPMPPSTLEFIVSIFPDVKFKQTYGLTEMGILPSKSVSSDSIGIKIGGEDCDVKIVDGILNIRTKSIMLGYLNAKAPVDEEGWYNTGDVIETMEDGYFRIIGRKSEIINVAGEKVFPLEVENIILKLDNIQDVTVRGASNPITGNIVIAKVSLIEPEAFENVETRIRSFCEKHLAPYKIPAFIEIADDNLYSERFKKVRRIA